MGAGMTEYGELACGPVMVKLALGDRLLARVEEGKGFEPETREWWSTVATAGTVIDIGAYSGFYAIAAKLLGAKAAVAVEPLPWLMELCLNNASRNGVKLQCFQIAASDRAGPANLLYNGKVKLSSGASFQGTGMETKKQLVMRFALDTFIDLLPDVRAIKIDVERHEAQVLRGAKLLLDKWRPKIVLEVLSDALCAEVLKQVPEYKMTVRLDKRNIVLEPR